jgi:hypothetical protein
MTAAASSDQGLLGRQHQEAGRHEQFVGDRIEHAAERGLLAPAAGEVAVENVGDAGGDEDDERKPAQPQATLHNALREHNGDDDRHGGNARVGQDIRQRQGARRQGGRCCRFHGFTLILRCADQQAPPGQMCMPGRHFHTV